MSDDRPYTLQDRCDDAALELRQAAEEGRDDLDDLVFELADSYTPIYTADLLRYALDDLSLACTEAFDTPAEVTAGSVLTTVIFGEIVERLQETLREIEEES